MPAIQNPLMITYRDLDQIRDNWQEPGWENPRFTRWIFSNGKVIDVAEDIQDKGIGEHSISFERHFLGRGMATDIVFQELNHHVIKKNISKIKIRKVFRENKGAMVYIEKFHQDDFLVLHVAADGKDAPARYRGVRDQPL